MVRGMAGAGGVIEEEWFVGGVDVGILNELDGFVGQVRSGDSRLRARLGCSIVVVVDQFRIPLTGVATQKAVVALEATTQRPTIIGAGGVPCSGGVRCHLPTQKVLYPFCSSISLSMPLSKGRMPL
jgi:hypothetical protein